MPTYKKILYSLLTLTIFFCILYYTMMGITSWYDWIFNIDLLNFLYLYYRSPNLFFVKNITYLNTQYSLLNFLHNLYYWLNINIFALRNIRFFSAEISTKKYFELYYFNIPKTEEMCRIWRRKFLIFFLTLFFQFIINLSNVPPSKVISVALSMRCQLNSINFISFKFEKKNNYWHEKLNY